MGKMVDFEIRKKAVLATVINHYIKEAEPVASEDISREFGLSSATIRNIFSELENEGYVVRPHTSAGRIPTYKGYRYYVDFLVEQMELIEEERSRINDKYHKQHARNNLEEILEQTSEVISDVTHYASIVSSLEKQGKIFYNGISLILEQPEFQDVTKLRRIIKTLESRQELLDLINRQEGAKIKIFIGQELGCEGMEGCALVISSYAPKRKPGGKLAVLGPARMEYQHIIPTLEYVSQALTDALEDL